MDTEAHIARVLARQDEMHQARERFLDALSDAVDAGASQVQIAETTGVSRVSLWRWLYVRRVKELRDRDGDACSICELPLWFEAPEKHHPLAVVVDHVEPQANGGGDALDNLALAHRRCNSWKLGRPNRLNASPRLRKNIRDLLDEHGLEDE